MLRSLFISFFLLLSTTSFAEYDKSHKCSSQKLATMKSKADKGDVVELYNLGEHYNYHYCAYKEDKKKAADLYEKAAAKGFIPAIKALFKLYYLQKDYAKCQTWCEKLLDINRLDREAIYYLALCEEKAGESFSPYFGLTFLEIPSANNKMGCKFYKDKYYESAYQTWAAGYVAFKDNTIANNLVYCCLIPGNGCKKDYIAAARIIQYDKKNYEEHLSSWNTVKKAADAGDAKACYAYYLIQGDKKYYDKALAAKLPEALWDKEYEKYMNKSNSMQDNSAEGDKEAAALYALAKKNQWYIPYLYEVNSLREVGAFGLPIFQHFLNKGFDTTSMSYLDRCVYENNVYQAAEFNYIWDFIYPELDPNAEKCYKTKSEKIQYQKAYLNIADHAKDNGIHQAARLKAWIYNDADFSTNYPDSAFIYAGITYNLNNYNSYITWGEELTSPQLLGKCYYEGIGTKKNRTVALGYLLESERSEAKVYLNRIYRITQLSKEACVVQDIALADYFLSESSKANKELLERMRAGGR